MSPVLTGTSSSQRRFPRVSGDEPLKALGMQGEQMFSPREQG